MRRPVVLVPLVLVVAVAAVMVWRAQRDAEAARAARADLLQRIESAASRPEPDLDALSRLASELAERPDRDTAPDLLAAAARIELARRRPERAQALFGARAASPGASPAEQALGAAILIRLHEAGGSDAAGAAGMLRQAEHLAERGWQASGDPFDLMRAWQAASRLQDKAAAQRHAEALEAAASGSAPARLAALAATFEPGRTSLADAEALRAEFPQPPPELDAMHVLLVLQSGDMRGAASAAEALLSRAPGVSAARWAAALVFHACTLGHAEGSAERRLWRQRRDVQLDWLLERSPPNDARRAQWSAMRDGG